MTPPTNTHNRRQILQKVITSTLLLSPLLQPPTAAHAAAAVQDKLDTEQFLRTGIDTGGTMGVSSQAGKSRPETGVILRDGSDISRDARTGAVLAEIVLREANGESNGAVLTSFVSRWPLATGPVFDVECRDGKTGDGVFLAVSKRMERELDIKDVERSLILDRLFDPTGRFSFYGPPTDIKVKSDVTDGTTRIIELKFSNLAQSTGAEIPRNAIVAATIPPGTANVVMLVGSANAVRWKKESSVEKDLRAAVQSFRAVPSPKTGIKVRPKHKESDIFM